MFLKMRWLPIILLNQLTDALLWLSGQTYNWTVWNCGLLLHSTCIILCHQDSTLHGYLQYFKREVCSQIRGCSHRLTQQSRYVLMPSSPWPSLKQCLKLVDFKLELLHCNTIFLVAQQAFTKVKTLYTWHLQGQKVDKRKVIVYSTIFLKSSLCRHFLQQGCCFLNKVLCIWPWGKVKWTENDNRRKC